MFLKKASDKPGAINLALMSGPSAAMSSDAVDAATTEFGM